MHYQGLIHPGRLTMCEQHLTKPHCSATTFRNDDAADVAPSRRNQGLKPRLDRLRMMRRCCQSCKGKEIIPLSVLAYPGRAEEANLAAYLRQVGDD